MAFGLMSSLVHEDVVIPLGWRFILDMMRDVMRVRGLSYLPQCPLLFIDF